MSPTGLRSAASSRQHFLRDVLDGLQRQPKSLPSKYFYDARGSRLFDAICRLDEYYLTRTELAIMRDHVAGMVECLGGGCTLIEFGSGSSLKTQILLEHLQPGSSYIPIDVSERHLERSAAQIARKYPAIFVHPLCADFTGRIEPASLAEDADRRIVYFPGSTIGNFEPAAAVRLLKQIRSLVGTDGGLLIGVDLRKPREILEPAYNDARGITARFNLNLLRRINRELGADFDLETFAHRAFFNADEGRIEMHLVSAADQTIHLHGRNIPFRRGETIHTENSYKHTLDGFAQLADAAGLAVQRVWCDRQRLFSVQYLAASA